MFTAEELEAVAVGAELLRRTGDVGLQEAAKRVLSKVVSAAPDGDEARLALRERAEGGSRAGTDLWFWTSMLVAGTVGTATGDWSGFKSGLELALAAVMSTVMLVVAFLALSGPAHQRAIAFWVLVVFVRNWGTNVGDLLADIVGLLQSTVVAAALTAMILYRWGPQRQTRPADT